MRAWELVPCHMRASTHSGCVREIECVCVSVCVCVRTRETADAVCVGDDVLPCVRLWGVTVYV